MNPLSSTRKPKHPYKQEKAEREAEGRVKGSEGKKEPR